MKLAGLLLVVIMVMGGIGYWYYNDTQARMAILQENNAQLSVAVATNEETIASLQADYARAQEETQRINAAYTEIRRQNSRLSNRLSEIDLSLLAAEKPDSIERAVNRGTVNAGRCFEILSGSPLTETELNATDGESFNKECPWLWPGFNTSGVQQPIAPAN
jgi:chromosome segregation ATPase